jgi:hypothetical protein
MDLGRVFATVSGFLEAEGFPVAVVGAFGLHAFGITRATQDLADIRSLLVLPEVDQAEVESYFTRAGMEDKLDDIRKTL